MLWPVEGSISYRASILIRGVANAADHARCMMPSATRASLAERKRREEAETIWL